MIKLVRPAVTLVAVLLAGQLLLTLVPFTNAQQPWRSNLLNLFSDNFRNLLQQIPSAPLPTASLATQPSAAPAFTSASSPSSFRPSPVSAPSITYDAYGSRYSRSKDEILQYSDEDPSIAGNGLQQANNYNYGYNPNYNSNYNYNPNYNSNYNSNYGSNNPTNYNPNPSPYQSPALNSFTGNYYNYQLADNGLSAPPAVNQFAKPAGQFDDDPLYSQYMLNKNKNLDPLNLNKNVFWNDYSNLGLDLSAYNLDNIYNNRLNYNRLPVAPAHVSFVPPPVPNLAAGNNQLVNGNQAHPPTAVQPVAAIQPAAIQPAAIRPVTDLQPAPNSPVTNNLANGNPLIAAGQPDNAPQSAYSSFLATNREALSSLNLGLAAPVASQLPNSNSLQSDQLISANSVEQKYEQAKPFYLTDKTTIRGQPVDLPAAPANLQPSPATVGLQSNVPAVSLPVGGGGSGIPPAAAAVPGAIPASNLPLNDLNQLYNAFASIPFNNNFHNFNTPNHNPNHNQISNPKVIYYDNFINHQPQQQPQQQPIASNALAAEAPINQPAAVQSPADPSNSLLLANTLDSSLSSSLSGSLGGSLGTSLGSPLNNPLDSPLGSPPNNAPSNPPNSPADSSLSDLNNHPNSLTTLTTSAGAVAPNLSSNLEVTTQPQLAKPAASSKATRKKPAKIKRKNAQRSNQRTNQRDFGSRNRRKDELEAIER